MTIERLRRLREERHRREREELRAGLILLLVTMLGFALAGTIDYQDRVNDLNGPRVAWGRQ